MDKVLNALPGPLGRLIGGIFNGSGDTARSKRGAVLAFAIRVASAGILFFSQVLLARWLGTFDFGIYTYIWVWVTVIGSMCALGFATTVVRFLPEYLHQNDFNHARGFLRTGHTITFMAGLICALVGQAALVLLDGWYNEAYRIPMTIALLSLPAFAMTDFQDGIGRSQSWLGLALAPPYIMRPLLLLGIVGVGILLGREASAVSVAMAITGAMWVTAVVQYFWQKQRLAKIIPQGPRACRVKFWLAVSLPVLLLDSFGMVMMNMDVMLLELFVEPDQVGIYYATARTISLIAFVHFAVAAAVMPRFAGYFAENDDAGIRALLKQARLWTLLPSVAGALILIGLGKPLLWLFGTDFMSGYPLMFVLVIGLLARAAVGPTQALLVVTGRQNVAAMVLSGSVVANIVLNLVLIPRFGLAGAAWATSVAYGLEAIALYLIARHAFGGGSDTGVKEARYVSATE